MSVRIHCPFCGQKYDLDDFREGEDAECTKCSQKFTLVSSLIDVAEQNHETPQSHQMFSIPKMKQRDNQIAKDVTYPKADDERIEKGNVLVQPAIYQASNGLIKILLGVIAAILVVLCVQMSKINGRLQPLAQMDSKLQALAQMDDKLQALAQMDSKLGTLAQMDNKLEALSSKSNPIKGYKLINYTWDYPALMESEFRDALNAGYEPVGYVCQNSIKGGFFLFVKRAK